MSERYQHSDALAVVARAPQVDPHRIGVVGVSLGGFIAGVQAAQDDRIAALVSESSGLSSWFHAAPTRMAPLMSVHSRDDDTVPLADAARLNQVAERFGVAPEMLIVEGRDHLIAGDAARRVAQAEADFLARVLRPWG